ncbi:MAG: hydrogenase maturation nickel metallochaperone HypA [Candidatus Didemnitutus sp.]|nr:hydrogenase maturation nickel metallochaperone HypA [Candidatus Didemnitutus sp.]
MHEVGIMESALTVITREARAHHAQRVERITLRIGAISGVEPDALRFAFEAVSPGSVADGAKLVIRRVPARAHCRECDKDFTIESGFIFQCPRCHAFSGDVRAGRELELARLEFVTPSTTPRHVH